METKECSTYNTCFSQISNAIMNVLKFQNNVNFVKIPFPYACLTSEGLGSEGSKLLLLIKKADLEERCFTIV